MKITDLKTYVTMPRESLPWLFVEVHTDEGVTGLGECTDYRATPMLVQGIEAVKPVVVGQDPANIEEIWQRIFHFEVSRRRVSRIGTLSQVKEL